MRKFKMNFKDIGILSFNSPEEMWTFKKGYEREYTSFK